MIRRVVNGCGKVLREEEAVPTCDVDFCAACGACLACKGDQDCPVRSDGFERQDHLWEEEE